MFRDGSRTFSLSAWLVAGLMLGWSLWCCCVLVSHGHGQVASPSASSAGLAQASWQMAGDHGCCATGGGSQRAPADESAPRPSPETPSAPGNPETPGTPADSCGCRLMAAANSISDDAILLATSSHSQGQHGEQSPWVFLPVTVSWQMGMIDAPPQRAQFLHEIAPPRDGLTLVSQACLLTI